MKTTVPPLALAALLLAGSANGLDIANVPLFVTGNLAPNVVLTLDDSGSMQRAYVAELCGDEDNCALLDNRWAKSAHGNPLYYNPAVRYPAPPGADRSLLSTRFGGALRDGFTPDTGSVDLGSGYRPTAALNRYSELECRAFDGGDNYTDKDCYMGHYGGDTVVYQPLTVEKTGDGAPYLDLPDFKTRHGPATSNLFLVKVDNTLFNPDSQTPLLDSDDCRQSSAPKGRTYRTRYIGDTLRVCFDNAYAGLNVEARMHGPARAPGEPYNARSWVPAYYYVYNDRLAGCADRLAQKRNNACYEFVQVGEQEQQNFANWYSFYRNRNLATISAAAIALSGVSPSTRVAWQALNSCHSSSVLVTPSCKARPSGSSFGLNAIGELGNSGHRDNLYHWLFNLPTVGNTPLRQALQRAGDYFSDTTSVNSPYHNVPGNPESGQHSCRRNFHIMMTDGIWNDVESSARGNDDFKAIPGLYDYNSNQPYARIFSDSTANTLSDLAFRYWVNDLATTLDNRVQPVLLDEDADRNGLRDSDAQVFWNARNNPASWQHMVNFTIGLGLSDYLRAAGLSWTGDMYGGSYDAIVAGRLQWPPATRAMGLGYMPEYSSNVNPDYGRSAHDLWHAAINSRGRFFSAESPDMLNDAFASALAQVEAATPTAAALASNSTKAGDGTRVYQARFDTRSWNGHLYALAVDAGGDSLSNPLWDAASAMPAHAQRKIFVRSGDSGASFTWDQLSAAQKEALDRSDGNGSLRLNWLRGDHGAEQHAGGPLRSRLAFERRYDGSGVTAQQAWVLGDIVSSDPRYIGAGSQGYDQLPPGAAGRSSYAAFASYKERRPATIYVGANDGMLHAFRASDGVELSAFIPSAVFADLHWLTRPLYAHRHFVDGSPGSGDAYLANSLSHASGWNTVVVSGLRGGGKSVFAVDATSPDSPSAQQFMWEYSDSEMGYSYSQPQVARLNDGSWAAVFGNGYESGAGSHLYLVNLKTGELIRKLSASTGVSGREGGLSTPVLVDENNDQIADSAYAGDLQGRLWKFDLSGSSRGSWRVANGGSPLFVARSRDGGAQPITVQPTVAREQSKGGFWIFFGTGRMLSGSDVAGSAMAAFGQSLYGLWDNGSAIETAAGGRRSELLVEQSVAPPEGVSKNGMDLRLTTDHPVDLGPSVRGWYMDLPAGGERVIAEALTVIDNATASRNRIVFVTAIPSSDPCSAQGSGWLMELHFNGRRPWSPVFDLNGDGQFMSGDDTITGTTGTGGADQTVSGIKSEVGIPDTVTWMDIDKNSAKKLMPGTKGQVQVIRNRGRGEAGIAVRRHWQQLM